MSDKKKNAVCADEACSCGHNHEEHCHCHDDSCGCGHDHSAEVDKKQFWFKVGFGGFMFVLGYIFTELVSVNEYIPLICFGISYIVVGFDIVK